MTNKLMKTLAGVAMLASLSGCGWVAPDAGEAGVMIRKPWFFGHGGVVHDPVTTGRSIVAFSTQVKYVNLNPQAFDIEYDDMMSSDGIPLDFHATLTLKVIDPVVLVEHFGGGGDVDGKSNTTWYENNIHPFENNVIRDAFKKGSMHQLAIEASSSGMVEAEVKAKIAAYIKEKGIPVEVVNFTLGRINPPNKIKEQRIKTAEEQQRQETERQTKIAEDNRRAAEQSRAMADNAYREAMNLSPEQFVQLESIHMQERACLKANCTFIVGHGVPVINTK